jgi:hypothetical protein
MTATRSHRGLGQSGYTAGRPEEDPALAREIEVRGRCYPRGADERILDLGLDERWTGRGGAPDYGDEDQDEEPPATSAKRQ